MFQPPQLSPELDSALIYASFGISAVLIITGIAVLMNRKKQNKSLTPAYIMIGIGVLALINPILRLIGLY